MATFHLIEPYKDYSGKTCSHSNIINCLGHTGVRRDKQWTTQICHPRDYSTNPLTASETMIRTRFAAVRAAVQTIKTNDTKYQQAMTAYAAVRNQYKSFDSYLWKTEMAKWDEENAE